MSDILAALANEGRLVAYFGYGSLVNRRTLRTEIIHAVPAALRGWRRLWRPRPDMPGFPAALLSVRREESASVDGLLVFDHADNLAAVDLRETHYVRHPVLGEHLKLAAPLAVQCPIYVYEATHEIPFHPDPAMILQSYLDAVMQGFLTEHGEGGLQRFLRETQNFETPIYRDRSATAYPRAVALTDLEAELFDRLLVGQGASYVDL